jgi:hypothetical protein
MFKLLQNASLGLALYSPTFECMYAGRNLKYIGLASGKISIYFKYNIPIISSILKNYPENKPYKLGYEILNVDQIPKILKDFDSLFFREDPRKYFNKYLAYDNYRERLLYSISNYIDK